MNRYFLRKFFFDKSPLLGIHLTVLQYKHLRSISRIQYFKINKSYCVSSTKWLSVRTGMRNHGTELEEWAWELGCE